MSTTKSSNQDEIGSAEFSRVILEAKLLSHSAHGIREDDVFNEHFYKLISNN